MEFHLSVVVQSCKSIAQEAQTQQSQLSSFAASCEESVKTSQSQVQSGAQTLAANVASAGSIAQEMSSAGTQFSETVSSQLATHNEAIGSALDSCECVGSYECYCPPPLELVTWLRFGCR